MPFRAATAEQDPNSSNSGQPNQKDCQSDQKGGKCCLALDSQFGLICLEAKRN